MGFLCVVVSYGFLELPNAPQFRVRSFYMGKSTLTVASGHRLLEHALLNIFLWLRHNELDATAHFGLPANRVVEMGARLEFQP